MTQTNPLHGFIDVVSEWNRMRHLGTYGYEPGREDRRRTHTDAWVPATDVFAKGKDLVIRFSLSGVRREDVDITFSDGALTISGERRSELPEGEVNFYVRERYYGAFRRTMALPPGVDESEISAYFENGMLEITVPDGAAAAPEPRRIEIQDRPG